MNHSFEKSKVYHSVYVNKNGNEQHLEKGASYVNQDGKKNVKGFKTNKNGNLEELSVKEAKNFIQQSKNMVPLRSVMPTMDSLIDKFKQHRIQSRTPTPHPLFKKLKHTLSKRKKNKSSKRKFKKVHFGESNNISQLFDKTEPPSIVKLYNRHNTQKKKRKRKRKPQNKKKMKKKPKRKGKPFKNHSHKHNDGDGDGYSDGDSDGDGDSDDDDDDDFSNSTSNTNTKTTRKFRKRKRSLK